MTNIERLAELIGEKGYKQVEVPCRECTLRPPGWEICSHRRKGGKCPTKISGTPLPPDELIEIAEGRWLELEPEVERLVDIYIYPTIVRCEWYGEYRGNPLGIGTDEQFAKASGKTEQEARMACAIAGLIRLKEEACSNSTTK